MRSHRLILAVLLALCVGATSATAGTDVGGLMGFSFSNLRIDGQSSLQGKSTFAAGVVADFGIRDKLGIRVEPTYLSKGTKATEHNAYWGTMDGAVFNLDYIDLPVLVRYDLDSAPSHGFVLGGLSYGIATKREIELTQGTVHQTVDMSDVLKSYDLSFQFALGMNFALGTSRLTIDGRTSIGLMNINDGGTVQFNGAPLAVPATSTHTLDFRLLATYLFPLGGS